MNRVKLFWEANKFPIEMPLKYIRFSSRAELAFDFLLPAFITAIICMIINIVDPSTTTVLKGVKEINNQTLTFISILAGFNITSISVLATSGSKFLETLRTTKSEKDNKTSLFKVMMIFFSASIVTQFLIILSGLIILIIAAVINIPSTFVITWYYWILFACWIYALLLAIFISIRNLKTLHHIMVNREYK
jgi:hypothetical protein